MIRIGIVVGTTRPGRRGAAVAQWVERLASASAPADAEFALVDLAEFDLPVLDEPVPAALGEYRNAHTRRWAETIAGFDGFVFVTPEYNHSVPAALKNAIDYLFTEWHDKAAGFVSYGLGGGIRAVEHLRLTLAEVKVAGVRSQVALQLFDDFEIADIREPGQFRPDARHEAILGRLLDEVCSWARALQPLRQPATV
jgi:NAD(P)H-dependent FMN reductase